MTDVATFIPDPRSCGVFESDTQVKSVPIMAEDERNQRFLALVYARNSPAEAEAIARMFELAPLPADIQTADVLRDYYEHASRALAVVA